MHSVQTAPLVLRYTFGALLSDGTEYFQRQDDVSQAPNPRGSAFYDLCEHHPDSGDTLLWSDGRAKASSNIDVFQLEGQGFRYIVDLRDGHFEIQFGRKPVTSGFFIQTPPPGVKLSLLYFRRRRHHFNTAASVIDGVTIQNEIDQECEYHFGWRAEVDGKLVDCTMFII